MTINQNGKVKSNNINRNSRHKNVYNSIGNVYLGTSKHHADFMRSADKLFYQYQHLIRSLGKRYSKYFPTRQGKEDLFMYINDTFTSLVAEYDINSAVDFEGYIKNKLELRIRGSYLNAQKIYNQHYSLLKHDNSELSTTLHPTIYQDDSSNIEYDPYLLELQSYIRDKRGNNKQSQLEIDIIKRSIINDKMSTAIKGLKDEYPSDYLALMVERIKEDVLSFGKGR